MFEEHLQNQKTTASELQREHNRVRQDNLVRSRAGMITMNDIRLELVNAQARNSPSFNSSWNIRARRICYNTPPFWRWEMGSVTVLQQKTKTWKKHPKQENPKSECPSGVNNRCKLTHRLDSNWEFALRIPECCSSNWLMDASRSSIWWATERRLVTQDLSGNPYSASVFISWN